MKRLNPKTNEPFKRGETREDGFVFFQYMKTRVSNGFYVEAWLDPKKFEKTNYENRSGNSRVASALATILISGAKSRCKGIKSRIAQGRKPTNGTVTITRDWILEKLNRGVCEATGDLITLAPGQPNTASLDRIDPKNPDYTPENCRIVTWQFNNMKGAFTDEEFIRVAEALKNVKRKQSTPVSAPSDRIGKDNPAHRFADGAGAW